jgi:hypothetical protein
MVTGPQGEPPRLPFLKRPMGYGTVGGCLITIFVLLLLFVAFILVAKLLGPFPY